MSAIFEAVIKVMPNGRWYIELRDVEADRSKECYSIDEFSELLEEWGAEYGHDVKVAWSQEENVTPTQLHEVRLEMMAYEQRLNEESGNI
jgi:hypothetical protein